MARPPPPSMLLLLLRRVALVTCCCSLWFRLAHPFQLAHPLQATSRWHHRTTISMMASSSSSSSDKPLLSLPIPGSATATLQIPSPAGLRALLNDVADEARGVGLRGGLARTFRGGLAAAEVAAEAAGDGELLAILREIVGSDGSEESRSAAPRLLRRLFERLGATYIKVGQFIASSPTLFPAEYVTEFQRCLDDVSETNLPFEDVATIIETELGTPVASLFEHIDPRPLASASIAQVHAAVLKEEYFPASSSSSSEAASRRVVVKVRKPGVEETLRADLAFLNVAASALEAVAPEVSRISLVDTARDLRDSMLGELDFRTEAGHLRTFAAFLDEEREMPPAGPPPPLPTPPTSDGAEAGADAAAAAAAAAEAAAAMAAAAAGGGGDAGPMPPLRLREQATCPEPILTSERVLVMTRLDGKPLIDALGGSSGSDSTSKTTTSEEAVVAALDTWCQSVVSCDFFHADLHGGNLLLLDDGRVGFLDFGIVGRLPEGTLGAVVAMRDAVGCGDFKGVAQSLVELGVVPTTGRDGQAAEVDIDGLADDLAGIFQGMQRATGGGGGGGGGGEVAVAAAAVEGEGGGGAMEMQDVAEVAQLALDVVATSERNGLVLPREFGLLVKQGLYFDRYLKTLAPDLNPFNDPRISAMMGGGGGGMAAPPEAAPATVEVEAEEATDDEVPSDVEVEVGVE